MGDSVRLSRTVPAGRAAILGAFLAFPWAGCGPADNMGAPTTVAAPAETAAAAAPAQPAGLEPSPFQIPCSGAGIEIEDFTPSDEILTASLAFEVPDGSAGVSLDWTGPYLDLNPRPADGDLPFLEVVVMEWTTSRTGASTRHLMKIGWPPFREAGLRVRSARPACESLITCSKDGCEVTS